ncbi:MAG: hypothetical protein AB7E60_02725 [Sphingobium sp.]
MLANKHKGEVAFPGVDIVGFEGGGVLLFDFNALAAVETMLKGLIEDIGTRVLTSPSAMITVMQAALEEHHGAVDTRTAGKIIQALGREQASELLAESYLLCFPEAAESGDADPLEAATGEDGTSPSAARSGSKSASQKKASGAKRRASSRKP